MTNVATETVWGRANGVVLARRAGLLTRLADWDARFRHRRALERLGPEMRADLGLSAEDIRQEVAKPIWRP